MNIIHLAKEGLDFYVKAVDFYLFMSTYLFL